MKKKKVRKKTSLIYKYRWWIFVSALIFFIGYVVIYIVFKGNGFLSAGLELEKKDWLAFLGAYLSFVGTVSVSTVAIVQSKLYSELNDTKEQKRRKKEIQPLFSVKIESIDSSLIGFAEAINLYKPESWPKHKNITISIENVGTFPINHVIVFDKYLYQLLKCNKKKEIQCAYEDSPDYDSKSTQLIRILHSDYECDEKGLPKWFNINYDDVDGNSMFQTFELKNFDGVDYYSLESINEV